MDNERIGTYKIATLTENQVKLIIRKVFPERIISTNMLVLTDAII